RARFIGSLIGLTDAQFNNETAAGQWTYRVIAKHVLTLEQHSLKTIAEDQAARSAGRSKKGEEPWPQFSTSVLQAATIPRARDCQSISRWARAKPVTSQ